MNNTFLSKINQIVLVKVTREKRQFPKCFHRLELYKLDPVQISCKILPNVLISMSDPLNNISVKCTTLTFPPH